MEDLTDETFEIFKYLLQIKEILNINRDIKELTKEINNNCEYQQQNIIERNHSREKLKSAKKNLENSKTEIVDNGIKKIEIHIGHDGEIEIIESFY